MSVARDNAVRMKKNNIVAIAAIGPSGGALSRISGAYNAGSGGVNRDIVINTVTAARYINGVIAVKFSAIISGGRKNKITVKIRPRRIRRRLGFWQRLGRWRRLRRWNGCRILVLKNRILTDNQWIPFIIRCKFHINIGITCLRR
ncbi:MAG: hypothetical protein UV53_C0028G0009 [Candidatus Azambacteria bacterium GW2011_GWE1_42_9]|nr:MAG: hypothetical protein UV53_C0028G0009 [Candidatus Azambacteria bacterium GW2011_GWE1_42_9]KKT17021.1 MAG: hypothetical protein UV99_C0002G0021 [Parcubacteria group bacterium GW2011_GWC1_43_61]